MRYLNFGVNCPFKANKCKKHITFTGITVKFKVTVKLLLQ